MKIQGKLTTLSLLSGLVPLVIAAVAAYLSASSAMTDGAEARLSSIRDAKKQQIELYFEQIHDQVLTFSNSTMVQEAMTSFVQGFDNYLAQTEPDDEVMERKRSSLVDYYTNSFATKYQQDTSKAADVQRLLPVAPTELALQSAYIAGNPHPLGAKEYLDAADDGSAYSTAHAKFHPAIRQYLREFGYYDIFLVNIETGNIVYSVFKELDYATSLLTGPYKDTNFARVFRRAAASDDPNAVFLEDFEHYTPSYEAYSARARRSAC